MADREPGHTPDETSQGRGAEYQADHEQHVVQPVQDMAETFLDEGAEVHFEPSDEQGDVEFIEIANVTDDRVDISGWQVTGAQRMSLPAGTELDPDTALVVCKDKAAFRKAFKGVKPVATFSGKLKNGGDTIRIEDPDGKVADEVTYDKKDPEVEKASGTGLSIRRVTIKGNPLWRAVTPTPGSLKS